jgi:hypothetical protein
MLFDVTGRANISGITQFTSGATSLNPFTGAAIITGGVGVSGNIYTGGNANILGTANVTGITTVTNATASTLTSDGALVVTGGVGIGGNLNVGGANANINKYNYRNTRCYWWCWY